MRFGNINICRSDIRFQGKQLTFLILLGLFGGLGAGALGIGGGAIFTPALISLGIPPLVTTATGLYLVLFSKVASCVIYFLNNELNLSFGLWIAVWATVGVVIGLVIVDKYIQKTGRQSIVVWLLFFMFVISVVAVPFFAFLNLKKDYDHGINLLSFKSVCPAGH